MSVMKRYASPPLAHTNNGDVRRLGVELEFTGMELADVSRLVADVFDGEIESDSDYEEVVDTRELGRFSIELDFEYLKTRGRTEAPADGGLIENIEQLSEQAIAAIAWRVVPLEVVTPPIPLDRLADIDTLVSRLRAAGALGTSQSPIYAFGLHLNPEMPSLDAKTVLAYLQAFLCLHDWLVEREKVDLSRRLTPYVNAFPDEYVTRVLAADYTPVLDELVDDYLASNADRNRALDLLPLFAHLDEARVRRAIDDPRIKARPTLHYRLPDCRIDDEDWGVHSAWSHWVVVEEFAADSAARAALCAAYLQHLDRGLTALLEPWASECARLIERRGR